MCDDGNTKSSDGCSSDCLTIEKGFTCTKSLDKSKPDICTSKCGDGIKASDEACDDGNTKDNDGCSADCKTIETGFTCTIDAKGKNTCSSICGDGIKTPNEACDDGNTKSNDGCSSDC